MFISFSPYIHIIHSFYTIEKRGSLGANERLYVTPVRERRRERVRERKVILKCGRMKNGLSKHDAIAGAVLLGY